MSLAQMEHDGAMTAGICVNSSDDFVSEDRCHLSVKGITQYDATFKSFPPETEPLSLSYAEKITPPIIRGVWFPQQGLQDYPYTCLCLLKPGVKEERELKWEKRENGRSEPWKVKQACVMFLERNTEIAKGGGW